MPPTCKEFLVRARLIGGTSHCVDVFDKGLAIRDCSSRFSNRSSSRYLLSLLFFCCSLLKSLCFLFGNFCSLCFLLLLESVLLLLLLVELLSKVCSLGSFRECVHAVFEPTVADKVHFFELAVMLCYR